MTLKPMKSLSIVALAALVSVGAPIPVAQAFNFGDMMNPGRWMGGNRDRYDDDYYDDYGPYGGYGPGPYGAGPYGAPYGAGPYGAPYGAGPYGAPYGAGYGVPTYSAPAVAPTQSAPNNSSEIDALKRRIEELESAQQPPAAPSAEWPSAPAFRPMNQY